MSSSRKNVRTVLLMFVMVASITFAGVAFSGAAAATAGDVDTKLTDTDGDLENVNFTVPGNKTTVEITGLDASNNNDTVIFYDDDDDGYQGTEELKVKTNSDGSSTETVTVNLTDSGEVTVGDNDLEGEIEVIEEDDNDGSSGELGGTDGDATTVLKGADVVSVGTDGSTSTGNGTDALNTDISLSADDRVLVAGGGSYDGSGGAFGGTFAIDKSGVIVESAFGQANISGGGGPLVDVTADDVEIKNIEIAPKDKTGISYASSGTLTVDNVDFTLHSTGTDTFGINSNTDGHSLDIVDSTFDSVDSDNIDVDSGDNKADDSEFGIRAYRTGDNVRVQNTDFEDLRYGVQLEGGSDHEFDGNTFKRIFTESIIFTADSNDMDLSKVSVTNNDFSTVGQGVYFLEKSGSDFTGTATVVRNNINSVHSSGYGTGSLGVGAADSGNFDGSTDSTATVNATNNWWGDASGPGGSDGPGSGVAVDDDGGSTTFTPWSIASGVSTRDIQVLDGDQNVVALADEIQTAIDNKGGPSDVVAVRLKPGEYDQTVDLDENLVLNSTVPTNTVIKNSGVIVEFQNTNAVVDGVILNKTGTGNTSTVWFDQAGTLNYTDINNKTATDDGPSEGVTVNVGSPTIENNSVAGFNVGIDTQAKGAHIQDNNILQNDKFGLKSTGGTVDAKFNYWGQGPSSENGLHGPHAVSGNDVSSDSGLTYDPFLTKQVLSLGKDPSKSTAFANDMTIPGDTTVTIGVPGQVPDNYKLTDVTTPFNGAIEYYNKSGNKWETISDGSQYDVSSLEALKITTNAGENAVVNIEYADSTGVGSTTLTQGWNFVPSPKDASAQASGGLDLRDTAETTEELYNPYTTPNNQTGTDSSNVGPAVKPDWQVTPFKGYWVFINDGSKSISTKAPGGTQANELRGNLGV